MASKLHLFVWESVLSDYTEGIAFCFAKNEQHAWELLKKEDETAWFSIRGRVNDDNRKPEQLPVSARPLKVNEPSSFVIWGGG